MVSEYDKPDIIPCAGCGEEFDERYLLPFENNDGSIDMLCQECFIAQL